jgi:ankyrin repeat protein
VQDVLNSLFDAVRFGMRTQVARLLERHSDDPDLVNKYSKGHTLCHWVAKKGDLEMLQLLYEHGADLSQPTDDDNKMYPIHWAAASGKIAIMRFLLNHGVDINLTDGNGCTPLVLAAQDGHASMAAFLLQNNADPDITDVNGDNALHWAAYKGHIEVLALLARLLPRHVLRADNYGQTIVHLSAMTGHLHVLEYAVRELKLDATTKDKNGSTPTDLAMKRGKTKCELFLRGAAATNIWQYFQLLGFENLTQFRILIPSIVGKNDREMFEWAFRLVLVSLSITSIITLKFVSHEQMADLYALQMSCIATQFVIWVTLLLIRFQDPGFVPITTQARHRYEAALVEIGQANSEDEGPLVCHTCGIQRPLRSKHCKVTGRCVHAFDHYCPFVGNVVGRDNYKYFFTFLVMLVAGMIAYEIASFYYMGRLGIHWFLVCWDIFLFCFFFMVGGLLWYHTQLVLLNLTTNEHMNVIKYVLLACLCVFCSLANC